MLKRIFIYSVDSIRSIYHYISKRIDVKSIPDKFFTTKIQSVDIAEGLNTERLVLLFNYSEKAV